MLREKHRRRTSLHLKTSRKNTSVQWLAMIKELLTSIATLLEQLKRGTRRLFLLSDPEPSDPLQPRLLQTCRFTRRIQIGAGQ